MSRKISIGFIIISLIFYSLLLVGCGNVMPSKIELISDTFKYEYFLGEDIDLNTARFVVTYSDGSKNTVSIDDANVKTNFTSIDTKIAGEKILTVTYSEKDNQKKIYTNIKIQIVNPTLINFKLDNTTLPKNIKQKEKLDLTKIKGTANYNDGSTKELTYNDFKFSEFNSNQVGEQNIIVTYGDKSQNFIVNVLKLKIIEMNLSGNPSEFHEKGTPFVYSNLKLGIKLENNDELIVDNEDIEIITDIDVDTVGVYSVTIKYIGNDYELIKDDLCMVFSVTVQEKGN